MSAEDDQMAAPDTPGDTAPQVDAEQKTALSEGLASFILKQAKEDGHEVGVDGVPPPLPEETPEEQPTPEEPAAAIDGAAEEPKTEEVPEVKPEEEKPAPKEKVMVPLREVMEERAKKERAKTRADEAEQARFAAEGRVRELEAHLATLQGPQPREDDPVYDVQDPRKLETLRKDYQRFLDETDDATLNDDGLIEGVLVGRNNDGSPKRGDLTPQQMKDARNKAKAALREHIPAQQDLLAKRYVEEQKVLTDYPELGQDKELQNAFAYLYNEVLTGRAAKSPDLSRWIVRAAKSFLAEQQNNGKPVVQDTRSQKIIQSAHQQIAPTPTRTRTVPVRRDADLAERMQKEGTPEAAEALIAARLFKKQGSVERLEPIGE